MATIQHMKEIVKTVFMTYHSETAAHKGRCSLFFWGSKGVGKSQGIKQAAEELTKETGHPVGCVDIRLAQMEPGDLTGIPVDASSGEAYNNQWQAYLEQHRIERPDVNVHELAKQFQKEQDRVMTWTRPEWFPTEGYGILFVDEFNRQDRLTYNASFELVLDGGIGRHRLPDGWMVVAAGNPISDDEDYNVYSLDDAMISRFCHITVIPDPSEWLQWASANALDPDVINFIAMNNRHLGIEKPKFELNIKPDPRVWHRVSDLKPFLPLHLRSEVIAGLVGRDLATSFLKTIATKDKPIDPRKILASFEEVYEQVVEYVGVPGNNRTDILSASNDLLVGILEKREKDQHPLTPNEGMNLRGYLLTIPDDMAMVVLRKALLWRTCNQELMKDPDLRAKMETHRQTLVDVGAIPAK